MNLGKGRNKCIVSIVLAMLIVVMLPWFSFVALADDRYTRVDNKVKNHPNKDNVFQLENAAVLSDDNLEVLAHFEGGTYDFDYCYDRQATDGKSFVMRRKAAKSDEIKYFKLQKSSDIKFLGRVRSMDECDGENFRYVNFKYPNDSKKYQLRFINSEYYTDTICSVIEEVSGSEDFDEKTDYMLLNFLLGMLFDVYNDDLSILVDDTGLKDQASAVVARVRTEDISKEGNEYPVTVMNVCVDNNKLKVVIHSTGYPDVTMQNFQALMEEMDMSKLASTVNANNPAACMLLAGIVTSYKNIKTVEEEKKEEKQQEDAAAAILKDPPSDAHGRWAWLMNSYKFYAKEKKINQTTNVKLPDYNLIDFPNSSDTQGITAEEKLRLLSYFYVQTRLDSARVATEFSDAQDNNGNGNTTETLDIDNAVWSWPVDVTDTSGVYNEVSFGNSNPYTVEVVKENADAVVDEYRMSGVGSASVSSLIPVLDDVVKYYAAQLYGITPVNTVADSQDESVSMTEMEMSAYIESVSPSLTTGIKSHGYNYNGLSKMKNMVGVKGSQLSYNAYLRLNYYMMLAADYAKESAGITDGNINPALDNFLKSCGYKAELVTDEKLAEVSTYIVNYLAIADALDYLGMDPFTDKLKVIYNYRNSLEPFRDSAGKVYSPEYETGGAMDTFFSIDSGVLSEDYKTGVELSATYVPMQTNLYDYNSVRMLDTENKDWVQRFHYPFGFYRKVLYIDKNINAAMDRYITGNDAQSTRIATLNDLLQPEKDVVLYLDTSFYNVDKLAEMQNKVYSKVQNSEGAAQAETAWSDIPKKFFEDLGDRDIETIVKTGGTNAYSRNVKKKVAEYGSGKEDKDSELILSDEEIDQYLTGYSENAEDAVYDLYTPLQSFAVVSAIYRQTTLFNTLRREVANNDPVFISSPNLAGTKGITEKEFNSLYNYAMLKNLESAAGIDTNTTIDKNSPLYMDIYGNIITESGTVVIPAMCNATLCDSSSYNLATVGFVELYSNGDYKIPTSYKNADLFMNSMLVADDETNCYELGSKRVNDVVINFNQLPTSDMNTLTTVKYLAQTCLQDELYLPFNQHVYLITEVMRGAPMENIDKDFEGISNFTVSKTGIYFAAKLDELAEMLLSSTSGNSLIELPNLAFMDGVEYVILFLYKIVFAASIALLFYRIYIDAVQSQLGFKSIGSFLVSIMMFLVIAFSIPYLLDISYYQVNKNLLQEETSYIAMLNYEKQKEGREVGVTSVDVPETKTELYLRIDDISVPWYSIIDDVLFKSTFKTVSDIYKAEMDDSILAHLPGTFERGNGLYMNVQDILDTSDVIYDTESNSLYTVMMDVPYASYITPYYVILDSLVARVNSYNKANTICDYTPKIMSQGSAETCGVIKPYFTSQQFMETSQDVLGLKYVEGVKTTLAESTVFQQEDIAKMMYSLWYVSADEDEDLGEKLNALDRDARMFVVNNRDLMGKVSDETFLKIMALSMAVKYNDTLQIPAGSAIEIYDIDARDIIKLSLADKSLVLKDSSKSFARFVYDNAGTLGVVVAAFLLVIYFVASFVKPVLIFIILGSMTASCVIRKTVKKDSSGAIEGLFITASILAGTNILYAVLLKISISIPDMGVNMVVSCVIQMLLQVIYLGLLILFTTVVLSDWRSMGFNRYRNLAMSMRGKIHYGKFRSRSIHVHSRNGYYKYNKIRKRRKYETDEKDRRMFNTGLDILEVMRERDIERRQHRGRR